MIRVLPDLTREILFDLLAHANVRVIKDIADKVDASCRDRENLVIFFHLELEIFQIFFDLAEQGMKHRFACCQDHDVISISVIIFYCLLLFDPVIEIGKVEVGQVLAQIVADRKPGRTVNDLVQKPQQIRVLELLPDQFLHYIVIDARVEFLYIEFETVPGAGNIS